MNNTVLPFTARGWFGETGEYVTNRSAIKQQLRIRFRAVSDFNGADCLKPLESFGSVVTLKLNRDSISWKTHVAHWVNAAPTESTDS